MVTIGTNDFGHYRGVATNQGFYFNAVGTKASGHYRGVAIKRGSTVCPSGPYYWEDFHQCKNSADRKIIILVYYNTPNFSSCEKNLEVQCISIADTTFVLSPCRT